MSLAVRSVQILSVLFVTILMTFGTTDISAAEPTDPGKPPSSLAAEAVTRPKAIQVITPTLETRLDHQPNGQIKVWVLFTDKGVTSKSSFDRAAASVVLTDRARQRRAKVGIDQVVFADLPVTASYVQTIENLGANHRRSSRWLNAATFELPARLLKPISRLPFVAEIKPMASFKRRPEPEMEYREDQVTPSLSEPHALNYGASINQLEQINVPAVHNLGYTGQGVTLAILDTGHRKTHEALAPHFAAGRVLAEYDFVYNDDNVGIEAGDLGTDHSHGTRVWSVAGGFADGELYGPAYQANFILCRTEDLRSETPTEEDNWVAALEFADSVGTDVITTSLGYMVFDDTVSIGNYTYADLDGQTAIISIAASTCDGLGIVMVNSAGNSGSGAGTITPPADAHNILAVGSVDFSGNIAGSSSRGPTYDGRIKPEVCARGVSTLCANPYTDDNYGNYSGTSFAAPLIAGAACLVIEAHPDWTPHQVREALKASGSRSSNPDNTYGWGIIDTYAAIGLDPPCCVGVVGNIDGLGGDNPTLADVSLLIDYLYINRTPIYCLHEADLNHSGGSNPTAGDISIGDVAVLIDHLYISGLQLSDCM